MNTRVGWKNHAYHFIFILSLLSLTLLVTWWAIFIERSIRQSAKLRYENIIQSVKLYSHMLGSDINNPPRTGVFEKDERFEIIEKKGQADEYAQKLLPYWEQFLIQPKPEYIQKIKKKTKSQKIMIFGESSLLLILILISGFMIYWIFRLEKRSTQELNEFWSRVTHEIKTPITGLKAFLQTLKTQELKREDMEPLIDLALIQVERQQQLSENILMGQKFKKKGVKILQQKLNIQQYIKEFVKDNGSRLSQLKVIFDNEGHNDIIVTADPNGLRIIFDNLADNAIKYGSKHLIISIKPENAEKEVMVLFKDDGRGFEPGMEHNIFDAYKRLKNELPEEQHGTGMGLYISRKLAIQMGGDLTGSSSGMDKGSAFVLHLKIDKR